MTVTRPPTLVVDGLEDGSGALQNDASVRTDALRTTIDYQLVINARW